MMLPQVMLYLSESGEGAPPANAFKNRTELLQAMEEHPDYKKAGE